MTYRDDHATCPSCDAALTATTTRWACEQCGGALVMATSLHDMLHELDAADVRSLDARLLDATSPARRCPCCAQQMTAHLLHDVLVDRCPAHGVWFDHGELETVLVNAASRAARRRMAGGSLALSALGVTYLAFASIPLIGVAVVPAFGVAAVTLGIGLVRRRRVKRARIPAGK